MIDIDSTKVNLLRNICFNLPLSLQLLKSIHFRVQQKKSNFLINILCIRARRHLSLSRVEYILYFEKRGHFCLLKEKQWLTAQWQMGRLSPRPQLQILLVSVSQELVNHFPVPSLSTTFQFLHGAVIGCFQFQHLKQFWLFGDILIFPMDQTAL